MAKGPARMRERMQDMVQTRKKNVYISWPTYLNKKWKSDLGALGVESPNGGAISPDAHTPNVWGA